MLGKLKTDRPLPKQVQDMLHETDVDQREIVFIWVPENVGIRGNEAANRAAIEAVDKALTDDVVPFSHLTPLTAKYIHQVWLKEWDEAVIIPKYFTRFCQSFRTNYYHTRKEDTVLNRFYIGHAFI